MTEPQDYTELLEIFKKVLFVWDSPCTFCKNGYSENSYTFCSLPWDSENDCQISGRYVRTGFFMDWNKFYKEYGEIY